MKIAKNIDKDQWWLSDIPKKQRTLMTALIKTAYNEGAEDQAKNIASNFFVSGQVCLHKSTHHVAGTTYIKCCDCGQIAY